MTNCSQVNMLIDTGKKRCTLFDFSLTIGYNVNTDNNVLFTFGLRY